MGVSALLLAAAVRQLLRMLVRAPTLYSNRVEAVATLHCSPHQ
jgi:hypothetical protein